MKGAPSQKELTVFAELLGFRGSALNKNVSLKKEDPAIPCAAAEFGTDRLSVKASILSDEVTAGGRSVEGLFIRAEIRNVSPSACFIPRPSSELILIRRVGDRSLILRPNEAAVAEYLLITEPLQEPMTEDELLLLGDFKARYCAAKQKVEKALSENVRIEEIPDHRLLSAYKKCVLGLCADSSEKNCGIRKTARKLLYGNIAELSEQCFDGLKAEALGQAPRTSAESPDKNDWNTLSDLAAFSYVCTALGKQNEALEAKKEYHKRLSAINSLLEKEETYVLPDAEETFGAFGQWLTDALVFGLQRYGKSEAAVDPTFEALTDTVGSRPFFAALHGQEHRAEPIRALQGDPERFFAEDPSYAKAFEDALFTFAACGTLVIGKGIPEEWIFDGAQIKVENIPVAQKGHCGFCLSVEKEKLTLTLSGVTGDASLELPCLKDNIASATVGTFNIREGYVYIPAGTETLEVLLKHTPMQSTSETPVCKSEAPITDISVSELPEITVTERRIRVPKNKLCGSAAAIGTGVLAAGVAATGIIIANYLKDK